MVKSIKGNSGRGSPDVWLNAAYELLLESGVDSVRIQPLAQQLKLSRTSFYWFFEDREALLAALLERWRDKNTGNFVKRASAYAETLCEAVLNVSDLWFNSTLFDARLEFAVRSWALQSVDVLEEVQNADVARLLALTDMFLRFGQDAVSADVRARTIYLTQIGYISMQTVEDMSLRLSRIPKYIEVFTGKVPNTHELDRFFARYSDT